MLCIVKRYKFFLLIAVINLILLLSKPEVGFDAIRISLDNLQQMLTVIPPIFIILGLLDIWVPREIMIKLTGEGSGLIGITIAFILGSIAAGPLYAAFPIAGVLLKKGSKLSNVLIFIGAWSTTKIPLLLFEAATMGWMFMGARLILDICGIVVIAYITETMIADQEKEIIYKNAQLLE